MTMEQLKRRLSFRKKKDHVPESSKPHQWQEDERKVREGTCSFQVRHLGCVEVFESRGMPVCEEAVKALKAQCKGKYQRAILYVSGDALRVVDEISKSMIVDQTIEKVSFCAPDRTHEKGFAYICRDGTTRRWMCLGFLAVKESGERLSHAVGCAFAICLERKQKRDKDSGAAVGVTVTYNQDRTSFSRTGSFRQTTLTERLADPQSAIVAEPVPQREIFNPHAVQRPHATNSMLERQGSFRGFEKLQTDSSPFKRTLSLRLNDLPSTLKRQNAIITSPDSERSRGISSPIQEISPTQENSESISQMCQQLTQGLGQLSTTNEDPFAGAPQSAPPHRSHAAQSPTRTRYNGVHHHGNARHPYMSAPHSASAIQQAPSNPWSNRVTSPTSAGLSNAELWLQSSASSPTGSTNPFTSSPPATSPVAYHTHQRVLSSPPHSSIQLNGSLFNDNFISTPPQPATQTSATTILHSQQQRQVSPHRRAPHLRAQLRSHSIDTGELAATGSPSSNLARGFSAHQQPGRKPTLAEIAKQQHSFQFSDNFNPSNWAAMAASPPPQLPMRGGVDPFDVAWAAKATNKSPTSPNSHTVKSFEVQL